MYDVIVVGGSLAGATTAYHLAVAGRHVALLERSTTLARKACGEGLFPRGVQELAHLGLLDDLAPRGTPLAGVRFHADGVEVAAPFGPTRAAGLGIQRAELDPAVLAQARAAGVEVRTGVTVRSLLLEGERFVGVRTDDGDVRAQVIVGADGIGSRLRRQAGLDRPHRGDRYGISAHAQLDQDTGDTVEVYFEPGYEIYVTPVGGRIVNVAVLAQKRRLAELEGDLRGWFQRTITRHLPIDATMPLIDAPVATGPFGTRCARPWRQNLVLVGDAAGFADAISGEGMSTTLVSARDCAAAVDAYLDQRDERVFARYARQRRALVRNSDVLARVTLALAARPALARVVLKHLARRPVTFARMVAISAGELPLRAFRPSDLRALVFGI